jgi:ABC-2 type transport system permease protein
MKAFGTLVKLYLNSIFRISVMRYSGDGRERRNAVMGVVAIGIIIVVYGGMSGMTSYQMIGAGIDPMIPFLMIATMASLFALAMAFAQGSATLSAFADFDTLMGMPIPIPLIVLARFFALYSVEALYCAAYLLPCGAIYAILCAPVWWFYPVFPIMLLLLPVVPVVIGSGADLLLSVAFARSKYKKGVTSTIKMILLMGFVVFAYMFPQLSSSFIKAPEKTAAIASQLYPPAQWFAKGATGSFPLALLFIAGSAVLCVLFVLILNRTFLPLHDRLSAGYHVKNYKLGTLKRSSALKALFTIERKRFFNSTAWVINTVIGSVLIAVLGIAGAALSGTLSEYLCTMPQGFAAAAITGVLIFCATISPTTSCAISMEGKEIWIAKTLPVSAKLWMRAKLLMNLLLVGPSLLFSTVLLTIAYRKILSVWDILGIVLMPVAALLFTTIMGLYVNARMPRLSWKSETEVVKQSGSVLCMLLIGFATAAVSALPALLTGVGWLTSLIAAAVFGASAALYAVLMKNAEQIRRNL